MARIGGLWLARSLEITAYRETAIEWPGFDGPVGLKIEIAVQHDFTPDGLVYPPEIRMGPDIEVPLDDAPQDPPEPEAGGRVVSPKTTSTASRGRPIISPAICPKIA